MKFGIKEAQAASVFAKTREQKESVLAVISMFNIPIVLDKQVNKQTKLLTEKIDYDNTKVANLKYKITKIEGLVNKSIEVKNLIAKTLIDWIV